MAPTPHSRVWYLQRNGRSVLCAIAWMGLGASVASLIGCEREGVEVHQISKGVERLPAAESSEGEPATSSGSTERPWVVPEGWTEDIESRPMRFATYAAPDPSGPVEVAVTRFSGRVGGEFANINRWRGQLGLPPISQADLDETITRFSAPRFDGYETRIEAPSSVMLAAGVYDEAIDQMWFVRATVPDAAVADRLQADLFDMARSIAGLGDEGDD